MKRLLVNNSFKAQCLLGLIIGFWLVFFLVLIAPFDGADLSFKNRVILMPPYGILFLLSYLIAFFVQKTLYKRMGYWNIGFEITTLLIVFVSCFFLSFAYYKTEAVNGTYSILGFLAEIYVPILLLLATLLVFGRWYLTKPNVLKPKKVVLRGESKTDVLNVLEDDILCASSSQNYVELHFMQHGSRKTQLLRKTLKKVQEDLPHLVQVHRSHLINPSHFTQWKGNQHILIADLEIPVSKNYKSIVNELI